MAVAREYKIHWANPGVVEHIEYFNSDYDDFEIIEMAKDELKNSKSFLRVTCYKADPFKFGVYYPYYEGIRKEELKFDD